ncbi:hypothetical protein GOP47_0004409 [Adiantum capillus-veneris]|uniref:Uncharacterized protein n=1 Tax=Adiantum capillus-veneris TaxID=13818 RepID=A0A9D4V7F1_ADICA|nr:hypothetical protein GOP47_0004409 [Adiantum capillus-veneris]
MGLHLYYSSKLNKDKLIESCIGTCIFLLSLCTLPFSTLPKENGNALEPHEITLYTIVVSTSFMPLLHLELEHLPYKGVMVTSSSSSQVVFPTSTFECCRKQNKKLGHNGSQPADLNTSFQILRDVSYANHLAMLSLVTSY